VQVCGNAVLAHSYWRDLGEKILLVAQTLIYHTHTDQHFDTEGGWSSHGNEESSSEEARKKGGQEEEVVVVQ
jgi:hypothetical protein